MEQPFHSFKQEIAKIRHAREDFGGTLLDYDEAIEVVRRELGEKLESIMAMSGKKEKEVRVKDKTYLRERLHEYHLLISDIVFGKNIRVRGYDGDKLHDFIEEMVQEFAGYSILSDAFEDPEVSDIYVLGWDRIFVERGGVNQKYWKTFRNSKHLKDTLDRFLREAGKEVNNGDHKIVDFELYGDRGCAVSIAVAPKDYSVTLRKHAEDHIQQHDLVKYEVLTEEMSDFLGQVIIGESNLIYAGLTGSGKTTTIRALLDHYVTKSNKRMLVCEDTQELFPKNEHTLEMVSVKSEDPSLRVTLGQLIITALRLKPKYIVVGEVRGEEAQAAVEGMETGHSTIFTMHGGTAWNCINRLVTKYMMAMPSLGIDVVERIIGSSVDYICIQDNIPGIGRRLTSIDEITYNFDTQRVELKPIFRFDIRRKQFIMVNKIAQEKADNMMRRGVQWEDIEQWVDAKEPDYVM